MGATAVIHATATDRAAALTLIDDAAVMTLAVTLTKGPWTAPVYYVYHRADTGFYFLSSPQSRHITAGLDTAACGAAVFNAANRWQEICGLQMRGTLTRASEIKGLRALALYMKKFPFSRDLLPAGKVSLETLRDRLGVRLYRFRPSHLEWTDNRVHFGYRCRLTL